MIVASREAIAEELWLYGEEDVAIAMLDTDDRTFRRVMQVAAEPTQHRDRPGSTLIAEALALGAVEVLTGDPRPLARKRRKPVGHLAGLWERVGADRDKRDENGGLPEAMRVADLMDE